MHTVPPGLRHPPRPGRFPGLPLRAAPAGRHDYIAQTERMRQVAAQRSVDVMLSNHPGYDGTVAKLAALRAAPSGPNPFVTGGEVADRSMRILNECARAQKARFQIS